MWNVTKAAQESFLKFNLLPIPESDHEWEMMIQEAKEAGEDLNKRLINELQEVKTDLLHTLPSRFIPYVENGTLNQPTLPISVREDYLQWIRQGEKNFEEKLDAAYQQTQQATKTLSSEVQAVFAESLHDSIIERIVREGEKLHLYINTENGFSSKPLIHLTFKGIQTEEADVAIQVGQWFIYYELQKREKELAFRVLFDCPEAEWTITMTGLGAHF